MLCTKYTMIKNFFNWNEDSVPQGSLCTNNLQWTLFPWGRTIECSCIDCTNVLISSWRFVNSLCLTLQGLYTIVHNELCFSPGRRTTDCRFAPTGGLQPAPIHFHFLTGGDGGGGQRGGQGGWPGYQEVGRTLDLPTLGGCHFHFLNCWNPINSYC